MSKAGYLEAAAVTLFFASRFCLRRSTTSSVGGTDGRRFFPLLPDPSAPCTPDVDPEAAAPAIHNCYLDHQLPPLVGISLQWHFGQASA